MAWRLAAVASVTAIGLSAWSAARIRSSDVASTDAARGDHGLQGQLAGTDHVGEAGHGRPDHLARHRARSPPRMRSRVGVPSWIASVKPAGMTTAAPAWSALTALRASASVAEGLDVGDAGRHEAVQRSLDQRLCRGAVVLVDDRDGRVEVRA